MQLPVSLEYALGPEAHVAQVASLGGLPAQRRFWHSLLQCWQTFTGLLIGLVCAFGGGFAFAGSLILVIITTLLMHLRQSAAAVPIQSRARKVRLEITDLGMAEHDEGVQAFMPWASMQRWKKQNGFLFIELRNHLSAIIASTDDQGHPINLEEIANLLREHGVKERS